MIARKLQNTLKVVKEFANSKMGDVYASVKHVVVRPTQDGKLLFECSDGACSIRKKIKNEDTKLEDPFCVDVFKFYDIINAVRPEEDIVIKTDSKKNAIVIFGEKFKTFLPKYELDQIFNITNFEDSDWQKLEEISYKKIRQAAFSMPNVRDNNPFCVQNGLAFGFNPANMLIVKLNCPNFLVNKNIIKKVFLEEEEFDHIAVTEKSIGFKNSNTTISIPTFTGRVPDVSKLLKSGLEASEYYCDVFLSDLKEAITMVKAIHGKDEDQILNTLTLKFWQTGIKLSSIALELVIPVIHYSVTAQHTEMVSSHIFLGLQNCTNEKVSFKLSHNSRMILCETDNEYFVGAVLTNVQRN